MRSPTAEAIFSAYPGVSAACAGISNDADIPLDPELLDWADHILVMEQAHKDRLSKKFKAHLNGKSLVVLAIADKFEYMQPELVKALKVKVPRAVRL